MSTEFQASVYFEGSTYFGYGPTPEAAKQNLSEIIARIAMKYMKVNPFSLIRKDGDRHE